MSNWLPLSPCFYKVAFDYLLSPPKSQSQRTMNLCKAFKKLRGNKEKFAKISPFKDALEKCSHDGPLVGFISKIIYVPNKNINEKQNQIGKSFGVQHIGAGNFFAFTRIFSGKLKRGDTIFVLVNQLDKEDQGDDSLKVFEVQVNKLFIWMGYHLDEVEEAGAGCICAIPEIGDFSVKYATISSSRDCPSLSKIRFDQNLLKVSVRTKELQDMPKLATGLKILKKVDPAIDMFYDEKGEMILEVSGEVHLEKCVKDLEDEFAKVEVLVSDPIITFKETIISKQIKRKKEGLCEAKKKLKKENKKAFEEDNKKLKESPVKAAEVKEAQPEEQTKTEDIAEKEPEATEPNAKKVYRYNTESSSFFESTSEEEAETGEVVVDEAWLYDDDRGVDKIEHTDTRYIFRESNFLYQKKKIEEAKVLRKGMNMRVINHGFLGLRKAKNHCDVETQNKKFKLHVRAIGLGQKPTEFLYAQRNKMRKLFGRGVNLSRKAESIKLLTQLIALLEEEFKQEPSIVKLILRHLISFGPQKSGPNLLLCCFAEDADTLTAPLLSDTEEYAGLFGVGKKSVSYSKQRPDYELYYAGINYEELMKSIVIGFEMSLEKGPLCNEEMYGCVFIIEDLVNVKEEEIKKQQLKEKALQKEDKEKKSKAEGSEAGTLKDSSDKASSQRLESAARQAPEEAETDPMEKPAEPAPPGESMLREGDENMIEAIRDEGMSASRSRNSKSILTDDNIASDPCGPITSQLVSAVKKGCIDSFLGADPRLVQGQLMCTVLVAENHLSSVIEALSIRKSKILENDYEDLTNMFIVRALMPMQESFGFFVNIMKLTSGRVSPQLEFAGWDMIEMDPFYQPKTQDVPPRDPGKRGAWRQDAAEELPSPADREGPREERDDDRQEDRVRWRQAEQYGSNAIVSSRNLT